jgi:hypothetical protein
MACACFVACGSDEESNQTHSGNATHPMDAANFVDQVLGNAGFPKNGETVKFTFPSFYVPDPSTECMYHSDVTLRARVPRSGESIVLRTRIHSRPFLGNPEQCPYRHPEVRGLKVERFAPGDFLAAKRDEFASLFTPSLFCTQQASLCQAAQLTRQEEVTHQGVRALYLETEFTSPAGETFVRRSWISRDSLLLGHFAFEIRKVSNGAVLDYRDYIPAPEPEY